MSSADVRPSRKRGENHPRALLSDLEVEIIRHLHAFWGWGYSRLADQFAVSKGTIADICKLRTRRPAVLVLLEGVNAKPCKRRPGRR